METGFANTRSPKQITNVNVGAGNTGVTAANPPEPGAAPPAPRPGTRGDDSGTGAPLAGARPERTAEPPPPGTRSTGRHRPRPPGPALPCPVPRPPGRQRRRSVSPRERGGDRAGSSAGPGAHGWARSGLPHLRAVLQRLLDGQLVDAGHGGGRADCAPLQLRSPQRSDPPLLPGHNTASPAPLRAGCPALPAWLFHWFFHPACPACYW